MAIIIGDIHGNVEKVKAFLAYRPDQEHVALGDYFDSFSGLPHKQIECLKLLLKSDAVLLWGNHDLHYLKIAPWYCSGRQWDNDFVPRISMISLKLISVNLWGKRNIRRSAYRSSFAAA